MSIAYVLEGSGTMTERGYDDLMAAMGFADREAPMPDGLLVHLAGATPDGGWRVIDVWESEEAADAFYASDRFAPVRALGTGSGPTITRWPMHRVAAGDALRARV